MYLRSGGTRTGREIRVFVDVEHASHSIGAAGYPRLAEFLEDVLDRRSEKRGSSMDR
jgi:hypothetical protein